MPVDKTRLEDADPLREGLAPLEDARTRMRQAVLAAVGNTPAAPRSTPRLVLGPALLVGGAAVIVAVGVDSSRVWSPGNVRGIVHAAQIPLEVRLAEETAAAELDPVTLASDGRVLHVHRQVLLTNSDVVEASVVDLGDGFGIRVAFTPSGAERLRAATLSHIGKPMAVMLDGRLALAPTLQTPLSDSAVISGDYTREGAERIAGGLRPR